MTFNAVIKKYLETNKINTQQLSKILNVNPSYIDKWLKGLDFPMFKQRSSILLILGKSLDNTKDINIKDNDGFNFTIYAHMANKYQTAQGRQKYYESNRWDTLKQKVFKRAGNKCEICGCKGTGDSGQVGLNIHHMCYESDFGTGKEDLNELICLCNLHHTMLHSMDNEKKHSNYEDRTDGKYKALIIEKADGSKDVKLYDDEVTDKQIAAWVAKVQHKYHFKYKNWYIKEFK